jgi:TRAP-type mannitol/chloroaromatic compound transport system permease large subunit
MRSLAPPEITLMDIYRSINPFMIMMTMTMLLIMIFPDIAMWLPNALK